MKEGAEYTYNLLKEYQPLYGQEQVYKEQMLKVLSICEDCFLRSCRVGHFTASALLFNKNLTHVLLMHHTKLDKWMQLGGHCDGDMNILNVAIKEAQEESGIQEIRPLLPDIFDIDIHLIPPRKADAAHYHFDIRFLMHAYDNDKIVKNHESKALKWVEKYSQNLPSQEYSLLRMFEKVKKYKIGL